MLKRYAVSAYNDGKLTLKTGKFKNAIRAAIYAEVMATEKKYREHSSYLLSELQANHEDYPMSAEGYIDFTEDVTNGELMIRVQCID